VYNNNQHQQPTSRLASLLFLYELQSDIVKPMDAIFSSWVVLLSMLLSNSDVIAVNPTSLAYHAVKQALLSSEVMMSQVPPGGGVTPLIVKVRFVPMDVLDVDDVRQVRNGNLTNYTPSKS
jgi:hypothetical protein